LRDKFEEIHRVTGDALLSGPQLALQHQLGAGLLLTLVDGTPQVGHSIQQASQLGVVLDVVANLILDQD
jgi:hypothetical protein